MQDYFRFGGKNSAILFQFLASSYQINIILNFTLSMNLLIHSFHTKMHIYSLILLYCISTAAILCFKKEKKNSSDLSKKRHLPGNPSSSNTKVATIFLCGGLEACCMCVDFRSTNWPVENGRRKVHAAAVWVWHSVLGYSLSVLRCIWSPTPTQSQGWRLCKSWWAHLSLNRPEKLSHADARGLPYQPASLKIHEDSRTVEYVCDVACQHYIGFVN